MTKKRAFKIHKGKGGLDGVARSFDAQGAGRRNMDSEALQKRSPTQGSHKPVVVLPVVGAVTSQSVEGSTDLGIGSGAVAEGHVVGFEIGAVGIANPSRIVAKGSVV